MSPRRKRGLFVLGGATALPRRCGRGDVNHARAGSRATPKWDTGGAPKGELRHERRAAPTVPWSRCSPFSGQVYETFVLTDYRGRPLRKFPYFTFWLKFCQPAGRSRQVGYPPRDKDGFEARWSSQDLIALMRLGGGLHRSRPAWSVAPALSHIGPGSSSCVYTSKLQTGSEFGWPSSRSGTPLYKDGLNGIPRVSQSNSRPTVLPSLWSKPKWA